MQGSSGPPSARTKVKRLQDRAHYDRDTILQILQQGLVCHVGIVVDGAPVVIPMGYAVQAAENRLLLHGSASSRLLKVWLSTQCTLCSVCPTQAQSHCDPWRSL